VLPLQVMLKYPHNKNIIFMSPRPGYGSGLTFAPPGHAKISTQNYFKQSPRRGYGSCLTFGSPGQAKIISTQNFYESRYRTSTRVQDPVTDPVSLLPLQVMLKISAQNYFYEGTASRVQDPVTDPVSLLLLPNSDPQRKPSQLKCPIRNRSTSALCNFFNN
jgi:hypothetical protein